MSQLLTWSEVDSNIQTEMGNRCPDSARRLEAINNEVRNINTVYDIETAIRKTSILIIPDGRAYEIGDLVDAQSDPAITDDDFKKVADIYLAADNNGNEYNWQEPEEFTRRVRMNYKENTYTSYWENGSQYIAVNSENSESTNVEYVMKYFSTFLGLDGSDSFITEVLGDANYKILLPSRFKDLVVYGAAKRLFWPSIGDDGNTQATVVSNKYKSELSKLGLDSVAKPLKKSVRKVKLRSEVGSGSFGGQLNLATATGSVNGETPTGVVDGVNDTFTLAHNPKISSIYVITVNGQVQTVGTNFTLSGNTITFLPAYIPQIGDEIRASYIY